MSKQQNFEALITCSDFRVKEQLRKAAETRHESGLFLNGGLERPLHEAMKVKPGCLGDPKMLEMPES